MKKHTLILLIIFISFLFSLSACKDKSEENAHVHTVDYKYEDQIPSTCSSKGSFTIVSSCKDCGEVISKNTSEVPTKQHTPSSPVKENEVIGDCFTATYYDEVIYCIDCEKEISRTKKVSETTNHAPGAAVVENERASTCHTEGGYNLVVYCTVCDEPISTTKVSTGKAPHTATHRSKIYATPTILGTIEHWHCSVCFKDFSDEACTNEVTDLTYDFIGVRTPQDLQAMVANKKYALVNNIDLNGMEWTPLFADSTFTGVFDGDGHVISNMTITSDVRVAGFFAYNNGTIQNLALENVRINISSNQNVYVGGIAGANYGSVSQCYVSGSVIATSGYRAAYVGAIVGENRGNIANCYSAGTVKAINSTDTYGALAHAGGIASSYYDGTITNCYSTCNVSAEGNISNTKAGGIVASADNNLIISGCYSTGNIIANTAGAIIASGSASALDGVVNCYRSSEQTVYGENQIIIPEEQININTIKTVNFHLNTLQWSEEIWNFAEGELPTLKIFE